MSLKAATLLALVTTVLQVLINLSSLRMYIGSGSVFSAAGFFFSSIAPQAALATFLAVLYARQK